MYIKKLVVLALLSVVAVDLASAHKEEFSEGAVQIFIHQIEAAEYELKHYAPDTPKYKKALAYLKSTVPGYK